MNKIQIIIIFVFCILFSFEMDGQTKKLPRYYRESLNVDSLVKHTPYGLILYPEVIVYPRKYPRNRREREKYNKMVYNFRRVYPYAVEISKLYLQIDDSLAKFKNDTDRKKYLELRERQIMAYYRPKLTKLTLSQGIMLVRLLDRESGNTAYEMIDELKGSVSAFFWQNFALMFGNNLKKSYNSNEKDEELEYLVLRYKSGTL